MNAFKSGDVVINKKGQVCKIDEVLIDHDLGMGPSSYYVLSLYFEEPTNKSKYFVPVSNENLIRRPIEKEKIFEILKEVPNIQPIWHTNPKQRKTIFKEMYDTGDPIKTFILIKSFETKKEEFANEKKSLSFTDENFLKEIKKNLYNEFAVSLDIKVDEVEDFIKEHTK